MSYRIYEMTGEYATDAESGQQIYDLIHTPLQANQPVELDFSGVNVFASAFFNFAIGQLLNDVPADRLNQRLQVTNLSHSGSSILNRVLENAKRYYSDTQYQEAVDSVLEEYAASV